MKEVIIIGAGPAGMTAAIYAADAGLSVRLIEKGMYGGQMITTSRIENYPGFTEIAGWELSEKMFECVKASGVSLTILPKSSSPSFPQKVGKILKS